MSSGIESVGLLQQLCPRRRGPPVVGQPRVIQGVEQRQAVARIGEHGHGNGMAPLDDRGSRDREAESVEPRYETAAMAACAR
ncbi:hypothetical protein BKA25_002763 [Actinoalloteichus hymeniacidonis]|uniref:Uncharacterized protein n=1 Tax=Actinoalloteichus hymeniacidonis TaxID=340345 RepID=A0AAC9MYI4_9PSEU|nr:hypothetical protein TL08_13475 [Actinoalloteichus hymeniacidonis]MBB5908447.1 hypothetical protein [Actinoalloteichus hymeniacidonis]